MKQSFDFTLPPYLQGNPDVAGTFKAAMHSGLDPVFERLLAAAQSITQYPAVAGGYETTDDDASSGFTFSMTNRHPLFAFLNQGTRPHVINGNPFLYFFSPLYGHVIRVRSVNHPGTRGNFWLQTVWAQFLGQFREAGSRAFYAWARGLGSSSSGAGD